MMMKLIKKYLFISLLISLFLGVTEVHATSGALRKASIKTCNGITYGQHGEDNHWHEAAFRPDVSSGWSAIGDPIYSDPCQNSSSDVSNYAIDENNNSVSENNSTSEAQKENSHNTSQSTTNSNSFIEEKNDAITAEENIKSSDNTLKELIIDGKSITINNDMYYKTTSNHVNIKVIPSDEKAKYEIENNSALSIGNNLVTITVTAEDGSLKTYSLNIYKNDDEKTLKKEIESDIEANVDDEAVGITIGSIFLIRTTFALGLLSKELLTRRKK